MRRAGADRDTDFAIDRDTVFDFAFGLAVAFGFDFGFALEVVLAFGFGFAAARARPGFDVRAVRAGALRPAETAFFAFRTVALT